MAAEPIQWTAESKTVSVTLTLTDRQANELYNDIYRLQRDTPGARADHPQIFAVYDTLDQAGVDGTR